MPAQVRSRTASFTREDDQFVNADAFPRRVGSVLKASRRDTGLVSPSKETFSFQENDEFQPHAISPLPDMIDEKQIARHIERGAPGDGALMNMVKRNASSREGEAASKRNTQYFGEVFAYREPNMTTREKVHKYSVITAEVKTNVIVKDEYVFLTDLSEQLSQRYQRPISSIFITLSHSACLLFAGTFDSAYILTITALPTSIQPTTNKRNAALLQDFLLHSLGVEQDRGVVRFVGVGEEYLATNGTTILGEIEGKNSDEETRPESAIGRMRSRRSVKAKPKDLNLQRRTNSKPGSKVTSPAPRSPALTSPSLPAIPTEKSPLDLRAEKVQKMGRRRSFLSMFGKKNP